MSDDEKGDDYGEYEDNLGLEGSGMEDEPLGRDVETEAERDEERGLDEDAAGSDIDDEEDEEDENGDHEDDEDDLTPIGIKATPTRQPVDPILRVANKPRSIIIVPPDQRTTDHRLHRNEAAFVIAMRAAEIAKTATIFTDPGGLHDPVAIATKELFDRRNPLKIRRQVGTAPTGEQIVEIWRIREMTLPPLSQMAHASGAT